MRGFKNNLERPRFLFGRCGEDAVVAFFDDPIVRLEIVDALVEIAREDAPGLLQRRLQNVACEFMALDKAMQALACVVAVKGNDAIEIQLAELTLQKLNFNLFGAFPKLAIQIQPTPSPTRAFHIAPGIDHRINKKFVTPGALRLGMQAFKKFGRSEHAALFIAVNAGKQTDTEVTSLFPGTGEKIPGKAVRNAKGIVVSQMRREEMVRPARQLVERTQERPKRSEFFTDRWRAVDTRIGILFRLINLVEVSAVRKMDILRRIPSSENIIHAHELDPRKKSCVLGKKLVRTRAEIRLHCKLFGHRPTKDIRDRLWQACACRACRRPYPPR